jgi:hypothetical protein
MNPRPFNPNLRLGLTLFWLLVLSYFFANVEIQIEGAAGWAANLPTWRIEQHWLLDIFWGGRAMTGYHAWLFTFIALVFHFPFFFMQRWSWKLQLRVVACIMTFWITEDFLWFVCNPAFGIANFDPVHAHWHKHWIWGAPTDYWIFSGVAAGLFWYTHKEAT